MTSTDPLSRWSYAFVLVIASCVCLCATASADELPSAEEVLNSWIALQRQYPAIECTFDLHATLGVIKTRPIPLELSDEDYRSVPVTRTIKARLNLAQGLLWWEMHDVHEKGPADDPEIVREHGIFAWDGETFYAFEPRFESAAQRRHSTSRDVELQLEDRPRARYPLWLQAIFVAHGYVPGGVATVQFCNMTDNDLVSFSVKGSTEYDGRRLIVLHSDKPPWPSSLLYHEVLVDPQLENRVVIWRTISSGHGKPTSEFRFHYSPAADGQVHFAGFRRLNLAHPGQGERATVNSLKVTEPHPADLFTIEPAPYMWVRDVRSGEQYRFMPEAKQQEDYAFVWGTAIILIAAGVVVVYVVRRRRTPA